MDLQYIKRAPVVDSVVLYKLMSLAANDRASNQVRAVAFQKLDELNKKIREKGQDIVMLPIDINLNETIITNLKKYYGINSTPAIIVNDKVFQGRVFNSEELLPT